MLRSSAPLHSPRTAQGPASKKPLKGVKQRVMGEFLLKSAMRPKPPVHANSVDAPPKEGKNETTSPPRKKVRMGPELYPRAALGDSKSLLSERKSNHLTRYLVAFQLNQTDENAAQKNARVSTQIITIINSTAFLLNEDLMVHPWRDRMKFARPPTKILEVKDWTDPVRIKLLTPGNLYISKGGWVNTKIRLGTFFEPDKVLDFLKDSVAIMGTSAGRASICPIQAENVDTVGWLYMSAESLNAQRLASCINHDLEYEVHCEHRNVFIPRERVLNKESGEYEDKWSQVTAVHIDCRVE